MSTKNSIIVSIVLIAIATIAGIALYSQLPDPMPSHWDAAGNVNDYMPKFWGAFLMPLISIGLLFLLIAIPSIDPLKANIALFRGLYNLFITLVIGFMLFIYGLTLASALGYPFNMTTFMMPAMGLLFIGAGYMMGKSKRNFFIGIRTPWTLSSENVWNKTHQLGKWMFFGAGIVTILSTLFGPSGFTVMIPALLLAAFVPIVYSYILWRQEQGK
jgi:uncharacterized membrane protein